MHLSAKRLKDIFENQSFKSQIENEKIIHFQQHPLLDSCLNSLIPYFEIQNDFPEKIASLKINEAIAILRTIDPKIDAILNNFGEPGKMDLKTFMEKNFMFNMPLEKFGYLTGRSLTTFKRDFHKAFQMTPQRWLTRKRLELAHYEMTEKNKKPADLYYEIGFENLSHSSFAFKKQYGLTPRAVMEQQPDG